MATRKAKLSVRWRPETGELSAPVHLGGAIFRYSDQPQVEIEHRVGELDVRRVALMYKAEDGSGGFLLMQPSGRQLQVTWNGELDQLPVVTYLTADGRGYSPGGHLPPEWASSSLPDSHPAYTAAERTLESDLAEDR